MAQGEIRDIVIVGGGTAGWMTAAALSKVLGTQRHAITLVESEEIGTVGVGEATIPAIQLYNQLLGLDEDDFVRETQATFKLGIRFDDWLRPGHSYWHPFGLHGADMNGVAFTHYWLRALKAGGDSDLYRYNLEAEAAREGRFARTAKQPGLPSTHYAFQFDAGLYAQYLRRYAERRGVVRMEGRVVEAARESDGIASVTLADGRRIAGDLFIDCSGFRGLLIEQTLQAGYDDWTEWLPCDRAVAVPSENVGQPAPFTLSTAREAGWQWRIPLQHRTGNGYVFSSAFLSEDEATAALLGRLEGATLAEPRVLRFTAGRRRRSWIGNCVAIGLSSGFLEPLESTSIHLIQAAISKLLSVFPTPTSWAVSAARFNDDMDRQLEAIRDFLIAHYVLTEREDTPFWRHCRALPIPDSLSVRLDAFRARGEVMVRNHELFRETNWFSILHGQGLVPAAHHPVADAMPDDELALNLSRIRKLVRSRVDAMPPHAEFLIGLRR